MNESIPSTVLPISVAILLPLIPAFLLYSKLKKQFAGKTVIKGPFAGLQIDVSGAFASYFLLVLTVLLAFYGPGGEMGNLRAKVKALEQQNSQFRPTIEVWEVWGQLELSEDKKALSPESTANIRIALHPSPQAVMDDGTFRVDVVKHIRPGGAAELPILILSKDGWGSATVPLEEKRGPKLGKQYTKTFDQSARRITIEDPIVLRQQRIPYNPSASITPTQNESK